MTVKFFPECGCAVTARARREPRAVGGWVPHSRAWKE